MIISNMYFSKLLRIIEWLLAPGWEIKIFTSRYRWDIFKFYHLTLASVKGEAALDTTDIVTLAMQICKL